MAHFQGTAAAFAKHTDITEHNANLPSVGSSMTLEVVETDRCDKITLWWLGCERHRKINIGSTVSDVRQNLQLYHLQKHIPIKKKKQAQTGNKMISGVEVTDRMS